MKRYIAFSILIIMAISSITSCKKTGPVVPYDLRIPPLDADLVIAAVDKGSPVSLLSTELYSPTGIKYTGYTDLFGRVGWNFDDMEKGQWTAKVPAQGRYHDSEISFPAANGSIGITFVSAPALVLEPATNSTYAYTTQTNIVLNVHYNQGGALNVPITLQNSSLPGGWTYNCVPLILGRETHSGVVSITVPTGQYAQPIFNLFGMIAGPTTYVRTDESPVSSVTIKRGFPVVMHLTNTFAGYLVGGTIVIGGTISVWSDNGGNIPWAGYIHIGCSTNHTRYWNYDPYGFTGSATINWSYSGTYAGNCDSYGLGFNFGFNSPIGTFNGYWDTGLPPIPGSGGAYTTTPVTFL